MHRAARITIAATFLFGALVARAEGGAAPPTGKSVVKDPGGAIEVVSTVKGATRIGVDKCKMCHKLQFDSWKETGHAKRTPALDCEGCHGPGSGYKAPAVMKDHAKSLEAGLVVPTKAFCETCHKSGWTDGMMAASHAHKAK